MRRKSFLGTLIFTAALTLSAMSLVGCNSSNKLELLYFGRPREESTDVSNRILKKAPNRLNEESDERYFEVDYGNGVGLEAQVKNEDQLDFRNIILYSPATDTTYVFTDGNSNYTCWVNTVRRKGIWITDIQMYFDYNLFEEQTTECFFDTYVEIESVNFVSFTNSNAQAKMAQSDIRRVNIHAEANYDNHKWTDWEYRQATCEECAGNYRHCVTCQKQESEQDWENPPRGHNWTEWEITKTPTCQEIGEQRRECTVCHKVMTQEIEAHTWGEWTVETKTAGVLSKGDKAIKRCILCNKESSILIPNFTAYTSFTIPSNITRIDDYAFENSEYLTEVTIPVTVESIGRNAFGNCQNLKDVYFLSEVPPQIGTDLFCGTWDADDFKIHVPCGAEEAYKNVNAQYWEYAIRRIEGHRVDFWTLIKERTCEEDGYEEGVCTICGQTITQTLYATGHRWSDEQTWHGATCEEYGGYSRVCTICGAIGDNWEDSNTPPLGHQVDEWTLNTQTPGVLKQGDSISGTCKTCGKQITETLPNIESKIALVIPDTITKIESYAFSGAWNLVSVVIPASVKSIGECAFGNCDSLREVYFLSTLPPTLGNDLFSVTWNPSEFKIYTHYDEEDLYMQIDNDLWQTMAVPRIVSHKVSNFTTINEGNCEAAGVGVGECPTCKKTITKVVSAQHNYGETINVPAASEGQIAYSRQICQICGYEKLTINAMLGTLASGSSLKTNQPSGFMKLGGNGHSISYSFNYNGQATSAKIYQRAIFDGWRSINDQMCYFYNGRPSEESNFVLTFNGNNVDMSDMKNVTYREMLSDGEKISSDSTYSPAANCLIGTVNLNNGANSFTYTRKASYNLSVCDFIIIIDQ